LRFGEFEGEWEMKKLGDVTEKINSGKTPLGGETIYTSEGVLFIRSQNINNDRLELEHPVFIPEKINKEMKNSIVQANDILLNITGASLGRSCVVPGDFNIGNVNQHVCIIRLSKGYSSKFIQPILSSNNGQNIFKSVQTGSGREGLNFESIKSIKVYFPSLAEQKKIADFLSIIDDRIQTQNKIILELESLIKGLIEDLFAQRLRFKDDKGSPFPEWKVERLGEIYSFKVTNSFSRENLNYDNGTIKNIHYGDIHTKFKTLFDITKESVPFINPEMPTNKISEDNYCKEGDLILADASEDLNDVGKSIELVNLNNERLLSGLHTILARPGLKMLSIGFGGYLFKSNFIRTKIQKEAQGSKVLSISTSRLSNIIISFPSIREQTLITNFLSSIDEKIDVEKTLLQQLENQKKYLLSNLFA